MNNETGPDCVCGTCDLQFVLEVSHCPDMVSVQGLFKTDFGSQGKDRDSRMVKPSASDLGDYRGLVAAESSPPSCTFLF